MGAGRPGEQLVRGALDERPDDVPAGVVLHPVERRHHLVGGVERQGRDARVRLAGERRVDPALRGENDQRALGRVTDERAVLDLASAQRAIGSRNALERDVGLAADLR